MFTGVLTSSSTSVVSSVIGEMSRLGQEAWSLSGRTQRYTGSSAKYRKAILHKNRYDVAVVKVVVSAHTAFPGDSIC